MTHKIRIVGVEEYAYYAVGCREGGEQGDDPGHPRQGGIQRVKSQKFKCSN